LVAIEYGLAAVAFVMALAMLVGAGFGSLVRLEPVPWVFIFSTAVVLSLTAVGLYQSKQRLNVEGVIGRLLAALGMVVVGFTLVEEVLLVGSNGWLWSLSFVLGFAFLGGARWTFNQVVDRDTFRRRVFVYGAGERAASLLELRRRADRHGFIIAG